MMDRPMLPRRVLHFDRDRPIDRTLEWLVANGIGGYASGPVHGGLTRRFHGLLVASLPDPLGRLLCLSQLRLAVLTGTRHLAIDHERLMDEDALPEVRVTEFSVEGGLPVWRYVTGGIVVHKRIVMPAGENTTRLQLMVETEGEPARIRLQPVFHVRAHEGRVDGEPVPPRRLDVGDQQTTVELDLADGLPPVRWFVEGGLVEAHLDRAEIVPVSYLTERARGYDHAGRLWTPGWIDVWPEDGAVGFSVSTESWDAIRVRTTADELARERARREGLLETAGRPSDPFVAELVLAADQFITLPVGRTAEVARARAAGDEPRTVIAGYHWFTDWGRDTMISLEGLTLATGRSREAGCILRTFGHHIRDGLIPNLFPEGEDTGLYHTADATLWFFHALHRYVLQTGDAATLTALLPALVDIAERHVAGTRFGIQVDARDGLLRQGAEGYQLTWMDAKVGDWVVTPRRGKAVEINALWYNALRLLSHWLAQSGRDDDARAWHAAATRTAASFNERFWNAPAGSLFDVIDGEQGGDDAACRPNQILAISLDYPVLDRERWLSVVETVQRLLVTPVGLRSLAPGSPHYCPRYDGDLHARDAAYHQGTVWAWLIGPFADACRRVYPDDPQRVRALIAEFPRELSRACVGTISEIFDAQSPYAARGCVAQAWSVAEVLRVARSLETVAAEQTDTQA
jgi:predicted glycogen debranching enzyme